MTCFECGIELMDAVGHAALARATHRDDPNHEVPDRVTHIRMSEDREGPACHVCAAMFAVVNNRTFFIRAQREFYTEQAQKRRMIDGN